MKEFKFKPVAKILVILIIAIIVAKVCVHNLRESDLNGSTSTTSTSTTSTHIPTATTTLSAAEEDDLKISQKLNVSHPRVDLTEDEIYKLAALVYLEARGESYECQKAIASVVINRMCNQQATLDEILYEPGQFSTIDDIDSAEPDESCIRAARYVVTCGQTIPWYVTFFRADHYHHFGDLVDYTQIDNTYFSYSLAIRKLGDL